MLLNMNFIPNAKDIFLWADGYWCFREDFYMQPRHNYEYSLVRMASEHWNVLRARSALKSISNPEATQPNPANPARDGNASHSRA